MEYSVHKLSQLAGVSVRTIRYYDEINLLKPCRIAPNGYRIYSENEVDILQQILFYRELDFSLADIKQLMNNPDFDRKTALENHLEALTKQKTRTEQLIITVQNTLKAMEGARVMSNREKFNGFREQLLMENESKYGQEIRAEYGEERVQVANAKFANISEIKWQQAEALSQALNTKLKAALEIGNPAHELAQEACQLHEKWLKIFWPTGSYSKGAHQALAQMYVSDERFQAYYEKIAPGATRFFQEAINIYCQ